MFCRSCGKPLEEGVANCPNCGAAVAKPAVPTQPAQAVKPKKAGKAPKPPKAPKVMKPPHKQGVPARVGCVLLSILLCLTLLFASVVTALRVSFSTEKLTKWVESIDLSEISLQVEGKDETVMLGDYLYEVSQQQTDLDLRRRDINDLLQDNLVKDFLLSAAKQYQRYLLDGSDSSGITTRMIMDYVEDNEAEIERLFVRTLHIDQLTLDYDQLEASLNEQLGGSLSIDGLNQASGNVLSTLRLFTGLIALILAWVLCALLVLGLVLANRRRASSLLLYIGLPILITGAILLLVGLAGILAPMIVASLAFLFSRGSALHAFALLLLILGAAMLLAGVLMAVAHRLYRQYEKKCLAPAEDEQPLNV